MNLPQKSSIRNRLIGIIIATSSISVLLACLAFIFNESMHMQETLLSEVVTLAEITGANSRAALVFDDPDSASLTLSSLEVHHTIEQAVLFRADGTILAEYKQHPDRSKEPVQAESAGHTFTDRYLILRRDIQFDDEIIGKIYFKVDLAAQTEHQVDFLQLAGVILILSLLVATLLSLRLERTVSKPILDLASLADRVSTEKNYSLRSPVDRSDELGILMRGFNTMLAEIEHRDQVLEQRVADQTVELRNERDFVDTCIQTIPSALLVFQAEQRRVSISNRAFHELFHTAPEYRPIMEVLKEIGLQPELIDRILTGELILSRETPCYPADRERQELELSLIPMGLRNDYLLVLHDVTARNRAQHALKRERERAHRKEQQLQIRLSRQEKLVSFATLTAALAHEIGNPLASLNSELEFMRRETDPQSFHRSVDVVESHVKRISVVVGKLRDTLRRGTELRTLVSIPEAVDAALRLARQSFNSEKVKVTRDLERNLPLLSLAPDHLELVIENILSNAFAAIEESGRIHIKAVRNLEGGVTMRIQDTGIGMTPEVLKQATEPLFTTKEQGVGFGLAISLEILNAAGGSMKIESVHGKGVEVVIVLPADICVESNAANQQSAMAVGEEESGH